MRAVLVIFLLGAAFSSYSQPYSKAILLNKTVSEIKLEMTALESQLLGESEASEEDPALTYLYLNAVVAYYIDPKSKKSIKIVEIRNKEDAPAIITFFNKKCIKTADLTYIDKQGIYKYEISIGEAENMGIISTLL